MKNSWQILKVITNLKDIYQEQNKLIQRWLNILREMIGSNTKNNTAIYNKFSKKSTKFSKPSSVTNNLCCKNLKLANLSFTIKNNSKFYHDSDCQRFNLLTELLTQQNKKDKSEIQNNHFILD